MISFGLATAMMRFMVSEEMTTLVAKTVMINCMAEMAMIAYSVGMAMMCSMEAVVTIITRLAQATIK